MSTEGLLVTQAIGRPQPNAAIAQRLLRRDRRWPVRGSARSRRAWPRGGGATCSGTSGGSPYSVAQDLTRAKGARHAIYLRALPYVPRRRGSLECFAPRKSERAEAARTQGQPVSGNVGKFIAAGRAHGDSESARSSLTSETPRAGALADALKETTAAPIEEPPVPAEGMARRAPAEQAIELLAWVAPAARKGLSGGSTARVPRFKRDPGGGSPTCSRTMRRFLELREKGWHLNQQLSQLTFGRDPA